MAKKQESKTTDEVLVLRERIEALNEAILRVNDRLELAVVLQKVVDRACELTNSKSGIICLIDEFGDVQDYVTCGISDEERRGFEEWNEGRQLFAHLRDLPGPTRLTNLPDYVKSKGFSPRLMRDEMLLVMPMRHHGELLGNFFLSEKKDGAEFTIDDEETLEVFASQAASSIANARAFSREERALADLAAVIETSPIGVVVFDGKTGLPTSFNREARSLVESLRGIGQEPEDLLDMVTCRFVDGSEIDLAELPMAKAMADAAKLRAEEVVISRQDGRSVRALINVTPIRNDDEIVSVVVTMQSLESLDEIERLRTEFVSMVSHELRSPLAAIKGAATTVLESTRTIAHSEVLQFFRIVNAQADHMQSLIADLLDAGRIETGTLSVNTETCDLVDLLDRARSMFLNRGAEHTIQIDLPHDMKQVMADPERIVQVLGNLFANAARHSPASRPIKVLAEIQDVYVSVSVEDAGNGVDPDILPHLFRKHVMSVSGETTFDRATGLGLAICKGLVEAHGGRIRAENLENGNGSRFTFTLPIVSSTDTANDRLENHTTPVGAYKKCILVVDDDPVTLRFVRNTLTEAGFEAFTTGDVETLANLIRDIRPDLVLLDLVLPGIDGIELMKTIPELNDVPVIFISGYGRDETIARALGTGAADYIVKPFSPTELCARVSAAIRLRETPSSLSFGALTIDFSRRFVFLKGLEISLTSKEYDVLRVLTQNAGKVVTFEYLIRHAWRRRGGENMQRVRAFIRKLRVKLEDDAANPTYIFNVHGVGYRFVNPSEITK